MQRVFLSNNLTVSVAPGRETAVDVLAKNTLMGSFQVKILQALGLLRLTLCFSSVVVISLWSLWLLRASIGWNIFHP